MFENLPLTRWYALQSEAGEYSQLGELLENKGFEFSAPATIASALLAKGKDESALKRLDTYDWWLMTEFELSEEAIANFTWLECEGLATLGELWLNGERLAEFNNMFVPLHLRVAGKLNKNNRLCIVIRSSQAFLAKKRARPGWKTNLVENQNLRWLRSSLLGYIPSWTPDIKPLGLYKGIQLKRAEQYLLDAVSFSSSYKNGDASLRLHACIEKSDFTPGELTLELSGKTLRFSFEEHKGQLVLDQSFSFDNLQAWWPHTHGEQALYSWRLTSENCSREGSVGFKEVALNRENGKVEILINGSAIFCRGACWTVSDIVALSEEKESLKQKLILLKQANMNMLRVGGTMLYESDDFYALCDELGILVWQDFMFANMDYPVDDETFLTSITNEAQYQTRRLAKHVSLAVYCGGSEVEQQAAMMGAPKEKWSNTFFATTLPDVCSQNHRDVPYFPSSPCEGDLPFFSSQGVAHYFGVGAYQRELSDLISSDVKFASECLAFSNIPSDTHLLEYFDNTSPPTHTPKWKSGVPRDNLAGWDFEDVRDYYCEKIFGLNPVQVRYDNLEKYHGLSRVVSGYLMAKSFLYWRSSFSACSGALGWFYNDIVPGAGWGLVDSSGNSKPALNIAAQALATHQCYIFSQGLEGHRIGVINESAQVCEYRVRVALIRKGKIAAEYERELKVAARGEEKFSLAALRGGFIDSAHAYRFGAEKFEAVAVQLFSGEGKLLSQDVDFPDTIPLEVFDEKQIDLEFELVGDHAIGVRVARFLPFSSVSARGVSVDCCYMHLLPGTEYQFQFRVEEIPPARLRADISSLAISSALRVTIDFPGAK